MIFPLFALPSSSARVAAAMDPHVPVAKYTTVCGFSYAPRQSRQTRSMGVEHGRGGGGGGEGAKILSDDHYN